MSDALNWLEQAWSEWKSQNRIRTRLQRTGQMGREIVVDGVRLINFGSNDYLGLAAESVELENRADGWGAGASPLVVGNHQAQSELEADLAAFEEREAAVLFTSGFAANSGTIPTLVGRGDIIFSDAKNHASIIDGCRLSGARVQVYPHADVDFLRHMLPQSSGFRRRLLVTDGVFSMDGDIAPLAELAQLAEENDCMLMVDEAHGTGILGEHGRGAAEHCQAESGVHVSVGTLSKALGSVGGFVTGQRDLIRWIENRARSFVFSTALPTPVIRAAQQRLQLLRRQPERRDVLNTRIDELKLGLNELGFAIPDDPTPIVPVVLGEEARVLQCHEKLKEAGVMVPAIRPPSVPEDESLMRVSVIATHTTDDLQQLMLGLAEP